MFNRENINPKVQDALFRKIDALNRKNLDGTDTNFFLGNALEPLDNSNPIEQHLYRGCFAKVSVAVPNIEKSSKGNIVQEPISISSYIENKSNGEDILESVTQKDAPLAFQQGFQEKSDNRFLGHSGITSISVDQLEYYTYKYTIGWVCPDPVFFEDKFEPSFLTMGAYCSMEFGWGMNDTGITLPSLSIEEMRRLLEEEGRLLKRNQESAGNYHCGVGTVTRFDWKILETGVYAGNLEVLTPGSNVLLETTQAPANSSDAIPVKRFKNTIETDRITKDLLGSQAKNDDIEEKRKELTEAAEETKKTLETLQNNSITFNVVMNKLEDIVDVFIEDVSEEFLDNLSSTIDFDNLGGLFRGEDGIFVPEKVVTNMSSSKFGNAQYQLEGDKFQSTIDYVYKNGALKMSAKPDTEFIATAQAGAIELDVPVPDYLTDRRFMSWGWFEDNILRNFFEMTTGDEKVILQTVKSVKFNENSEEVSADDVVKNTQSTVDNYCQTSDNLFSLGLDHVILPNKTNPIMESGFNAVKTDAEKRLLPEYYPLEERQGLARIYSMFKVIDNNFPKFVTESDNVRYQRGPKGETVEQNSKGQYYYIEKKTEKAVIVKLDDVGVGVIRNMVFPVEKFKTHFAGTTSLRQGLRSFWADVSNQYGGYWGFEIGQDVTYPVRVGVFDSHYSDKKNSVTNKLSTKEDPTNMFEFSVLSDKSIVKSFDVNLELSAEAATLARYGGLSKANTGTTRIDGKKELGLEAWNILTSDTIRDEILTKEQLEKFDKIQPDIVKNLQYPKQPEKDLLGEDGFAKLDFIEEDLKQIMEKVENQRTKFIKGIGCYDKRGNFSQFFKRTMLYLINYADIKGCQSNIEKSSPLLPISITLTIDGIGGLKVGDLFKVDYLPELYRKHCYFMIKNIKHSITTSGWDTEIEAVMIVDMPDFWENSGKKKAKPPKDFLDLFTLTNVPLDDIPKAKSAGDQSLFVSPEDVDTDTPSKKAYDVVKAKLEEERKHFDDPPTWLTWILATESIKHRTYNRYKKTFEQTLPNKWAEYRQFLQDADIVQKTNAFPQINQLHQDLITNSLKFLKDNKEKYLVKRKGKSGFYNTG